MTTLYQELNSAGIETGNWQSDLYFPVTKESKEILSKFPNNKAIAKIFKSNIDGKYMYEVHFAFDPFWESRK